MMSLRKSIIQVLQTLGVILLVLLCRHAFAAEQAPDVQLEGITEVAAPVAEVTKPAETTTEKAPPPEDIQAAMKEVAKKNVKEEEIPVKLEAAKKAEATASPWYRMLLGLLIIGLLAGGSFIAIKRRSIKSGKSSLAPEIKILTKHFLGPKKELLIVRVAGESILIGVTDQNINLIKSLSLLDEDIPEEVPQSFAGIMEAGGAKEPALRKSQAAATFSEGKSEEDEFSISAIASVVSHKLRNSRMLQ
jgi:flagellar protein FliO/FliZ